MTDKAQASNAHPDRTLVALLASPPTTSGARTMRGVETALPLTGCTHLLVANLYPNPTRDIPSLKQEGSEGKAWLQARPQLQQAVEAAHEVLAGWGLSPLAGLARRHRETQITWLLDLLASLGHDHLWTVGGQPRHPSRWHQYVSDKHQRTAPGTFAERLSQVLVRVPLETGLGGPEALSSKQEPFAAARKRSDLGAAAVHACASTKSASWHPFDAAGQFS